jgi:hypothetical protein
LKPILPQGFGRGNSRSPASQDTKSAFILLGVAFGHGHRPPVAAFFRHLDDDVFSVNSNFKVRYRIQSGHLFQIAADYIEGGLMPGAIDPFPAQGAFGQMPAIMSTDTADGVILPFYPG